MNVLKTATVRQYNIKPRSSNVEGVELRGGKTILTWLESEM